MKIILSRKGFDSGYGGCPSFIMPDRRLISLPIPWPADKICYSDLRYTNEQSYFDIMKQVRPKIKMDGNFVELTPGTRCHLDPDLERGVYPRHDEWRPVFGQVNQAQRHLENQGVGIGDIFLFFGLFRRVIIADGRCQFDKNSLPVHLIFGYLQISEIIKTKGNPDIPGWLMYHPHLQTDSAERDTNTLYIASERLSLDDSLSGGGMLKYSDGNVLTKTGMCASRWDPPDFFRDVKISYHGEDSKYGWKDGYFQSALKGQEFVIEENPSVENWAGKIIREAV